ncbi:MAG: cold-shock protein [Gemmatimonas sp.]
MNPSSSYDEIGTVEWFDDVRGCGFLRDMHGLLLYVHYKDIAGEGHRSLRNGQRVIFRRGEVRQGPRAQNVEPFVLDACSFAVENFGWLLRSLIAWLHRRGSVRYTWVYYNDRLKVNLARYHLLRTPLFEIFIHQFFFSDEAIYHDHPWAFCSIVLAGAYVEETSEGELTLRRAPSIESRSPSFRHRVIVPVCRSGRVWSFVIAGRRFRPWRFFDRLTMEPLTTSEYARKRGFELRVDSDFHVRGVFFPTLVEGTRPPTIVGAEHAE